MYVNNKNKSINIKKRELQRCVHYLCSVRLIGPRCPKPEAIVLISTCFQQHQQRLLLLLFTLLLSVFCPPPPPPPPEVEEEPLPGCRLLGRAVEQQRSMQLPTFSSIRSDRIMPSDNVCLHNIWNIFDKEREREKGKVYGPKERRIVVGQKR